MKKNNKLKVEVINKYFYPVAAGIEIWLLNTNSYISKRTDLTIHTSKDTLNEKNVLKGGDIIQGIKVKRYPFTKFGFFPKVDWFKTDILILNNFDIFPHFQILIFCLLLKILGKKKFLLKISAHGGFNPPWSVFPFIQAFIKRNYHISLGVWLINYICDGVHTISEWERREIIKMGVNSKLVTNISNGLEDEAFLNAEKWASKKIKSQVKKYGRYIIQIGRIHPIKNYETTILALSKIDSSIKYVIVGPLQDLEYKKYLDDLIKKFHLSDRVIFADVITGVDKYYLLRKAQMMVHMALWESFCNTVHEGLSQGLICIVANNTALPYLVKDKINGYCVETKDYESLAERINYVLENENSEAIKKIKKNNQQTFGKRTWKQVSKELFEFYTEML